MMPEIEVVATQRLEGLGISTEQLIHVWVNTDYFLRSIPYDFGLTPVDFYTILSQRNLSGFVGEAFASASDIELDTLRKNPHPDGRPDLLNIRSDESRAYFHNDCFDSAGNPIRQRLAPYRYGGIEIKATIGQGFTLKADEMPAGQQRLAYAKGINYWAHHRHACTLMGIYYDYFPSQSGSPQICALFLADIREEDWNKVSIGSSSSKKTSNTSLSPVGRDKIRQGLIAYRSDELVQSTLARFKVTGV